MSRTVTLTTDFGSGSGYVAELKGRLLHARQPFTLVDIAHDVPAHDIRAAAWLVGQACFAFPEGTLHVVVVDPGVGTSRRLVWARVGEQEFLCPDNGVLTVALDRFPLAAAREIVVPRGVSATFHGRDVLAPAAAQLIDGDAADAFGPVVTNLDRLHWPRPQQADSEIRGEIVHVDHFGNLITNLPASLLPRLIAAGRLRVGAHDVTTIVHTYGEAAPGAVVALVGSQGFIEAAVVEGRAADRVGAGVGTKVTIP